MRLINVAAAAVNQTALDWTGNERRIKQAIDRAFESGVEFLLLPELAITGYGVEDRFFATGTARRAMKSLLKLAHSTRDMIFAVGLPVMFQHALYNCVAVIVDGVVRGFVPKQHLAGDGVHYEQRWFKEWPEGVVAEIEIGEQRIPIGDLIFEIDGVRFGFEVCEDAWIAGRPGIRLSKRGVDVIANPSASHFAFGKRDVRDQFVIGGSRELNVIYVYANLQGNEAGRVIYDGDRMIATVGELVARGRRFSFAEVEITSAVVDVDRVRAAELRRVSFRPELRNDPGLVRVKSSFKFHDRNRVPTRVSAAEAWELSPDRKNEELMRAEALGLFDYLRKSKQQGFVVSLSGGADSSAVSCMVAKMVELAVADLGLAEFKARLSHIAAIQDATDVRELVGRLLLCLYQGTENSSETTLQSAREVANALGAEFHVLNVGTQFSDYREMIERVEGRRLRWDNPVDDLALQSLQARVRSPAPWGFANVRRRLFLVTSNRSEADVGYATMDGDTSGGLAPIGGIDKASVLEWLTWLEQRAGNRVAALSFVNALKPTAELRPFESKQTDEDDLMPYVVLRRIEQLAIRDSEEPQDVYELLRHEWSGRYSREDVYRWVRKFYLLWAQSQWKRERFAVSFHLDDLNVDPRSWCRFPVISSNFADELAELDAHYGCPAGGATRS